jgi:hypothetical protein
MSAHIRGDLESRLCAAKMHDPRDRADALQVVQAYVKLVDCFATHANANVISKRPIEYDPST